MSDQRSADPKLGSFTMIATTLGELIDSLERIREKTDSAVTVFVESNDGGWFRTIRVEYDKESDQVTLRSPEDAE